MPPTVVLPDVPDELKELFSLRNRDLDARHWGTAMVLWMLAPSLPRPTSEVIQAMNVSRWTFWPVIDQLVKRHIIWLRYGRKSRYFDMRFISCGKNPHVDPSCGKKPHVVTSGKKPHVGGLMGEISPSRALMGEISLGGGGVYIHQPPTPEGVLAVLDGEPFEWCKANFPDFDPGELIPAYQDAIDLRPEDPHRLFLGALGYLAKSMRNGFKPNNLVGKVRHYIQHGHVLSKWPTPPKKAPSNAKSAPAGGDAEREAEIRDLLNKYADRSLEEIQAELTAHAFWAKHRRALLENFTHLLKKNPCLDEFKAWASDQLKEA